MNNLGKELKQIRISNNLTVRGLGKMLNISYSLISKFENGTRNPSLLLLQKIREALNLSDIQHLKLLELDKPTKIAFTSVKGGEMISWKIKEATPEFKSIYPTT